MDFRSAKKADFDRVVYFYRCSIENTPGMEKYARWIYGQHPTDAMIADYIDKNAMYILEEGKTIVGAMALTMYQGEDYHPVNWSIDAADDEVAVVHILCVHPNHQRKGIGKRLVRESIAAAKEGKKKAVRLDSLRSNTPAQRMYLSLGFEYRGEQNLYAENTGWTDFLYFEYRM